MADTPSKLTLTYFKIGGRAEAIRLTAAAGKVAFTNKTISFQEFATMKDSFPLGEIPTLEIEMPSGETSTITQSVAILRYFGKRAGLYPTDEILAMKVDSIVDICEDLIATLTQTVKGAKKTNISTSDWTQDEKIAIRQRWVENHLPRYLGTIEADLKASKSGWIVGENVTIADIQLYAKLKWIKSGVLDGIPPKVLDEYPACVALMEKVKTVDGIKQWMESYTIPYDSFDYQP